MLDIHAMNISQLNKTAKSFCKEREAHFIWEHAQRLYETSESPKFRYYAIFLLGHLAPYSSYALHYLKETVSEDQDWRAQEVLSKAFESYCADIGYDKALPCIREWLEDPRPNVRRAVIEGLRVWTNRPYFRFHPQEALELLAPKKTDPSDKIRKSAGSAISDISKKHRHLVAKEVELWDRSNPLVAYTYEFAVRHL